MLDVVREGALLFALFMVPMGVLSLAVALNDGAARARTRRRPDRRG